MTKRWIAGLSSFILAVTLLFTPGVSFADNIKDKKEKIKKRDKEIQRLEKEKKQTKVDVQKALAKWKKQKKELQKVNQSVYSTEQQLAASKRKIKKKKEQIKGQQNQFNDRVRVIYKQGNMFYLKALSEAKSLGELLDRIALVRQITKQDRHLLDTFEKDQKELAQSQTKMKSLLVKQKQKASDSNQLYKKLTADYAKMEKDLKKLGDKKENLEEVNEKEKQTIRDLIRQNDGGGKYTGGRFSYPVNGKITSPYGMRYHPILKRNKLHSGVDFSGTINTPIHAPADGKVIASRPANGYGYIVVIDHGGGISTLYAHMYPQNVKVKQGDTVRRGERIAGIGNNGWSTGAHLHFEVLKNGQVTNPMPYLK
ncbi:Peptidase family M23 [Marininema mesophilum]|uniref:Peptidase family M23 n=1 Tax=Marininema mesophilum TaxID=1048340 RepID=A0A1H2TLP2_9BACL|nr:M23 family metallopeptidase [Marininema mesophilum]SDW44883.1 Peptidase family M23 [Marininema mesophilum]